MSMGAGVTTDTLRQAAAWPLSILVLAVSVVASIAVCSFWFERIHGWDRTTARFAAIPGALPAVLAMAVGTSADLPRVALAQSLRLVTLVAVMPPLLRWLAVPSTGTTTSIGTPGNLSGFLLLLGASAATAGLMYRMRFPGGVFAGSRTTASAVLHGTGMIQGLLPPDLLAAGFHRNRRRDRKQVPQVRNSRRCWRYCGHHWKASSWPLSSQGCVPASRRHCWICPWVRSGLPTHPADRSNVHRCVCPGLRCRFCRDAPCRPLCRSGPDRPMVADAMEHASVRSGQSVRHRQRGFRSHRPLNSYSPLKQIINELWWLNRVEDKLRSMCSGLDGRGQRLSGGPVPRASRKGQEIAFGMGMIPPIHPR